VPDIENPPNCIGFVLHSFGLIKQEEFVDPEKSYPQVVIDPFFDSALLDRATAFAVIEQFSDSTSQERILHMGLLIRSWGNYDVVHRPDTGLSVVRDPLKMVFEPYAHRAAFIPLTSRTGKLPTISKVHHPILPRLPKKLEKYQIRLKLWGVPFMTMN
jgi:hypothetical protein